MAENDSVRALNEGKETPEEEEDEEEEKEEENPPSELQSSAPSVTVTNRSSSFDEDLRNQSSQSEALGIGRSVSSSENDHEPDCGSFSRLLASAMESPVANSTAILADGLDVKRTIHTPSVNPRTFPEDSPSSLLDAAEFKGQFEMSQQEILASVTAQDAQSMSSAPGSTSIQQKPTPVPHHIDTCMTKIYQQNSLDQKTKPAHVIVKTPSADGYNWRKYGQKQVKSSESSRSYYKCTYSDCYAKKKIEQCDHSGHVIEIIYKGQHTHDPPLKIRCTRARRLVSSSRPFSSKNTTDSLIRKLNESYLSPPRREPKNAMLQTSECKEQSPSCSVRSTDIKAEQIDDEPEPKRRMKESSVEYSVPLFKTVKEPKVVVQSTGDVGISGDGYRWRKYGQKMVKGNPCPRSYYKCTSAGCPVRKHVERATDDTAAIIITYEGKHDHDMPVPKKRHGQPSAALLIAAAAAMNNAQFKKAEALPKQRSPTQCSMNMESEFAGEKAFELGGEKVLESARTLLSIGIELKPC